MIKPFCLDLMTKMIKECAMILHAAKGKRCSIPKASKGVVLQGEGMAKGLEM